MTVENDDYLQIFQQNIERFSIKNPHEVLNLSGADLRGIDLSGVNLSGADLSGADLRGIDLRGANLRGANLRGANLIGANLSEVDLSEVDLSGAILSEADLENVPSTVIMKFTINEEPFTAQNFTTLLNSFTDFHTKLWLITKNRFGDLIDFSQTHDARFVIEANLTIEQMSHNSPGKIELGVAKDLADGVNSLVEGVGMYNTNKDTKKAGNEKLRTEIKILESQIDISEDKTESEIATEAVKRRIISENAEQDILDREQKREFERKEKDLKLREMTLQLEKQEFELQKDRTNYAFDIAQKISAIYQAGMKPEQVEMIVQALLPSITGLLGVNGLEAKVIEPPQLSAPNDPKPQGE